MGILSGARRLVKGVRKDVQAAEQKAADDAAHAAKVEAGPPQLSDAEKQNLISAAGQRARESASGLIQQAQQAGDLGRYGLDEASLTQRAAERAGIFSGQQGILTSRQGVAQREAREQMAQRLGAQGLRGTGTAERLAEVAQRRMAEGASGQQAQLQLTQGQQELAARQAEQQAAREVTRYSEQSVLQAEQLATQLEAAGKSAEEARLFASDEAEKQRFFQDNVVLKMQSDQFRERMDIAVNQFKQQMKLENAKFDFDKVVTKFNMDMAEAEAGKGGMFDQLGKFGTDIWKTSTGGNVSLSNPFGFRSTSPQTADGGFGARGIEPDQWSVGRTSTGGSSILGGF